MPFKVYHLQIALLGFPGARVRSSYKFMRACQRAGCIRRNSGGDFKNASSFLNLTRD